MSGQLVNKDYLREAYEYARFHNAYVWLRLAVSNGGTVPLNDIALLIDELSSDFMCACEADIPNKPSKRHQIGSLSASLSRSRWGNRPRVESPGVSCRKALGGTWSVWFRIAKVQPGMTRLSEPLLVGATTSVEQRCEIVVAADELPSPVTEECFISVNPRTVMMRGENMAARLRKMDLEDPEWESDGRSIKPL